MTVQALDGARALAQAEGVFTVPTDDERAVLAGRIAAIRRAYAPGEAQMMQCAAHWLAGYWGEAITACMEVEADGGALLHNLLRELGNPPLPSGDPTPARQR